MITRHSLPSGGGDMGRHAVIGLALRNPLYKEVKRKITESLRRGEWRPSEAIPSEKKLGERFGVSIGTVRKAIDQLTAENILIRHQGRGTFVASHGESRYFFSFFHIARQDGYREYPGVELVDFARCTADPAIADALRVEEGARLFRFTNLLRLEGSAVIVDDIMVPVSMFPGLTGRMLRERSSTIYRLYEEGFGVSVLRTVERLRAVRASKSHAALLGVKAGHPLLLIIRVALSFRDQPVELRYSYVNTEAHEYNAEPTIGGEPGLSEA
ncbi:MAG: GntR family transcriptional regulator [Burkholderiales bacterium]|nr:GntR family transcriptional regulator [Burkholderiales bacterium]